MLRSLSRCFALISMTGLALLMSAPAGAQPFPPSLDLSTLNGTNGFVLNGFDPGDASGASVSAAGDVNGDGIGDVIIGAPNADPNGINLAGESYRIQEAICETGDRDLFPELNIPRSTIRSWIRRGAVGETILPR
jgi:hypothetical protein